MTKETFTKTDLAQFTGTEKWYLHSVFTKVLYTDGIKYVADKAGAYWLIDYIAFAQQNPKIATEEFQVWKLHVNLAETTAVICCEDGNYNLVHEETLDYTDFPLEFLDIFFTNNVIHLPSEY